MSTPTLDRFVSEISRLLRTKNDAQLRDYLVIEPPYPDIYHTLIQELRSAYPVNKGNGSTDDALESKLSNALPEARDGVDGSATWSAFIKFMRGYLGFLRDVDTTNLLETYGFLSELLGYVGLSSKASPCRTDRTAAKPTVRSRIHHWVL